MYCCAFCITTGDHPRSRGVYFAQKRPNVASQGSSPLARGLLHVRGRRCIILRIIPACAGFTHIDVSHPTSYSDHPRSRGVYIVFWRAQIRHAGSSPLARGLRRRRRRPTCRTRIIPARAGFTSPSRGGAPEKRDHPRSRGVYRAQVHRHLLRLGSSPLARGLRRRFSRARDRHRIIPARAGFTRSSPPRGWPRAIIPARAGFTGAGYPRMAPTPDHPRSRGVYSDVVRDHGPRRGSSPLARGLRSLVILRVIGPGIIPARAGFTLRAAARPSTTRDHPRSRGVYRALVDMNLLEVGIIPARAGFTEGHTYRAYDDGDHPRSRGVYTHA